MSESPEGRAVLGRAATAGQQVEKAVCFILHHYQAQRISIIAIPEEPCQLHSLPVVSLPMGLYRKTNKGGVVKVWVARPNDTS